MLQLFGRDRQHGDLLRELLERGNPPTPRIRSGMDSNHGRRSLHLVDHEPASRRPGHRAPAVASNVQACAGASTHCTISSHR
jgi:hypothetical protein